MKNEGTDSAFEKSRLVVQAFKDSGKDQVLTESPTIQRVSQRLIICLAASTNLDLCLRDISQAYVQSSTILSRDFYVRPPEEMGFGKEQVLKVVKPLYGVPEAGNHWFHTYHKHHVDQLSMEPSTYDPCLLIGTKHTALVGMQTDDTLILADAPFLSMEEEELEKAKLLAKEREKLQVNHPLNFNGGLIQRTDKGIYLSQKRQCNLIRQVQAAPVDISNSRGDTKKAATPQQQYVAQRARGAYIATVCQPEAAFDLSQAAQTTSPDDAQIKALNARIRWQQEHTDRGLTFVPLDLTKVRLIVYSDAAFANNADLTSQIGYVITLDDGASANIIHWSSTKCKRVTRSVLAAELYGMVNGFDISAALKETLGLALKRPVSLVICTDSKSLFDCLVKLGTTAEKRLMIDIMSLRQSYERRQIAEIRWISGESNPADAMTKGKCGNALRTLIDTNTARPKEFDRVERPALTASTLISYSGTTPQSPRQGSR
jgi:Reverse transcriptase (RNA-dependent DNA polymerase)